MILSVLMSSDEINSTIPYPVIVEGWDKKEGGKVKRAYEKEFTETERQIISKHYPRMYNWYFLTGSRPCYITIKHIALLERAGSFFGGI